MADCAAGLKDQDAKQLKVGFCLKIFISPTDIYLINNKCENENIYTLSYKQMATRKYLSYHQMWVANHDNNEEGTFTNWYTGQVGRPSLHEQ